MSNVNLYGSSIFRVDNSVSVFTFSILGKKHIIIKQFNKDIMIEKCVFL